MVIDAEKDGVQWAKNNDNRITSIGKILRRSRLDELPQLISVLKGEMSLIGPRPERPEFNQFLNDSIPLYNLRSWIKPGLSGWAQVNYPYAASTKDAQNKCMSELRKLKAMSPMSAEATVVRNYLDWMIDLPWSNISKDIKYLDAAQNLLDEDHY